MTDIASVVGTQHKRRLIKPVQRNTRGDSSVITLLLLLLMYCQSIFITWLATGENPPFTWLLCTFAYRCVAVSRPGGRSDLHVPEGLTPLPQYHRDTEVLRVSANAQNNPSEPRAFQYLKGRLRVPRSLTECIFGGGGV